MFNSSTLNNLEHFNTLILPKEIIKLINKINWFTSYILHAKKKFLTSSIQKSIIIFH